MAADAPGERTLDPGIKLVLEEWRQERRQADEAWQLERRQADAAWQRERRQVDEQLRGERREWKQSLQEMRLDMRQEFRELREDAIRREAVMLKAFTNALRPVHTVGLAIVKTLNRHTQILERIDRRLAAPGNGRRGRDNGRGR